MSLPQEPQQRLPVVLPELLHLTGRGELAAAQLQRDLHAAVPDVVVVLHPPCQRVPGSPVGRSVLEVWSSDLAGLASEHPPVVEAVGAGQVLEHVVVRGERRRGEDGAEDGVGRVVEGVARHQGSAVDVAGEDELDLADPLLHCLRLGLRPLVVLLEIIREVPVEVEASGVVSALTSLTCPLAGHLKQWEIISLLHKSQMLPHLKAVWVHAGHDVDPGVVQQPPDVVVRVVVLDEVEDQVEHQLPPHRLVAVHVGHVLHVGFADHVLVGRGGDHHHPELSTLKEFL